MLLQKKIQTGFAVALVSLMLTGAAAWWSELRSAEAFSAVEHTYQLLDAIHSTLIELLNVETAGRGFALTGDEKFLSPYYTGVTGVWKSIEATKRLTQDDPVQQRNSAVLESLAQQKISATEQIIGLRRRSDSAAVIQLVAAGTGKQLMDKIRAVLTEMERTEKQHLQRQIARTEEQSRTTMGVVALSSLLAVGLVTYAGVVVRRDFVKRQQAEAERDRFFNLSVDLFCIAHADGYFKRVNPAFTATLGWSSDEMLARPFLDFIHPDDRAPTQRVVEQQVVAGEPVLQFENRYRHQDGSWRLLSWKSVPQPGSLMFATGRDVTAERLASQQLAEIRRHHELLFDSCADGLHELNLEGAITFENLAAERMLGYVRGELLGRPAHVTIHHHHADGTDFPVEDCPIYATLRDGQTRTVQDEVFWRKDGTSFPVEYTVAPVTDGAGGRRGAIVAFRDVTERRCAEVALRQAHEGLEQRVRERTAELQLERAKLAAAFANMEMGVVFSNAQGDDITMNPAAERMHGFASPTDMHARLNDYASEWELRDPAGRVLPFAEWPLSRALRGDFCHNQELHLHNLKSHHEWDCSYTAVPVRNSAGAVTLIVLTLLDITARNQAGQALRRSEANLLAAQAIAKVGSSEYNPATGEWSWSSELLRMVGLDPVRGVPSRDQLLSLVHPDERNAFLRFYDLDHPTAKHGEFRLQLPDGRTLWTEQGTEPVYNKEGRLISIISTCLDITQRKETEEKIRELNSSLERRVAERTAELTASGQRFRALVAASARIIWRTDPRGRAIEPSPEWRAFVGVPPEGSTNDDWTQFIHPDDRPRVLQEFARGLASLQPFSLENRVRRHDGVYRDMATLAAPVRDPDGTVREWVGALTDVTEKNKAEAELRRAHENLRLANAELAQAARHKNEFLANMSHELRTPLNAILGLSEALLENTASTLTPRQIKSLTTISTSGQHLLALINDILDLSKIEAGRLVLNWETLNLPEFCESCLAFVRTQAMQKNIGVAFEPAAQLPPLTADPKRLKQLVVNLLTNAVKFTPEGGRIGLTVSAPEGEEVVRLTVWDTGIGIAPGDTRLLFKAFTQIDSGLNRAQEGTGLGLALVAKLAELHGGSVALESEPGKGSRFTLTLPIATAPAARREPPGKDVPDRRSYRRALIIEDDPTSSAILVSYLHELGIQSELYARGEESVAAALRHRPDVILLDILLPNDSGWVVLTRLKEHPGTRDIPVIVVSVLDEPAKSRALGAAGHFTKPVRRPQLAEFFQRAALPPIRPAPPASARGPLLLLAEDNEANIETIGGYLEDKGYVLVYATNGLAAVQMARERHPALILMDIQMPVLDGLEAIKQIRADPALTTIPIVALTALAMPGDREICLAAGANDYLSKPVSLKELAALVAQFLARA